MNNARTPTTCSRLFSAPSTRSNTKRFSLRLFWQSDKSRSIEKGDNTFCCHPLIAQQQKQASCLLIAINLQDKVRALPQKQDGFILSSVLRKFQ